MSFGGIRSMWVFALFDLPVDTKEQRAQYRRFHDTLVDDGFQRIQYSVYARHCASAENSTVHEQRILAFLPPEGEVRLFQLTDLQFERIKVFVGNIRAPTESAPEQLTFL